MLPSEIDALYSELLSKVSARFDLLSEHHQKHMSCGQGCHRCCHPQLTISEIEARLIRSFLAKQHQVLERVLKLEIDDPYQGARCSFLNAEGKCEIYLVRPIVCRSFGVPLLQIEDPNSEEASLAVCELNFTGNEGTQVLENLTSSEWLDTHQTDVVLAQLNYHLSQALEGSLKMSERVCLRPSALIQ